MTSSKPHKSGFVNIIGNPNVGKSTFMNAIVGERLSIVTSKAQTTRHRIFGIVNGEDFQVVFSDTPGVIEPKYKLQTSMMNFVRTAFEDLDILIYMVEVGEKILKDKSIFHKIKNITSPILLLINKIDLSNQEKLEHQVEYWSSQIPQAEIYPISAKEGFYIEKVFDRILQLLPVADPYYPKDSITDKPEQFFAREIIREKILKFYDKEVPYSIEVVIESFVDEGRIIKIDVTVFTERESQKVILLGLKGAAIKKVGVHARKDLEAFFCKKIYLKMFVKVIKNWRTNSKQLSRFGY